MAPAQRLRLRLRPQLAGLQAALLLGAGAREVPELAAAGGRFTLRAWLPRGVCLPLVPRVEGV